MKLQRSVFFLLGGLLVAMPEKNAEAYCRDLFEVDGTPSWIVGEVRAAATPVEARTARLSADVEIVEVPHETLVLK